MALLLFALLASLQVLCHAEPVPSPTKAAASKTALISAGPITLAPGYTVTSTVIAGQTYPIFSVGGQGGYQFTATSFSASGLLGITLANVYSTLPDGQVYPAFEVYVNAADSELFTIPGVLTFRDGGVSTAGPQATDVKCSLGLSGGGCSDLAGLVTGTVFGQPFTQVGGVSPVLTVPSPSGTFVAGITASGSEAFGSTGVAGQVGGGIVTAPSFTSAGLGASGAGDFVGGAYEATNGTTHFVLSVCETKVLNQCTTITA